MTAEEIRANAEFAAKYLSRYGYLPDVSRAEAGPQHVTEAPLASFQEFAGLPKTGLLDEATVAKMKQPRCGCPDILRSVDQAALARWRKNRLTYHVRRIVPTLDPATVKAQVRLAFDDWSKWADIQFTELDVFSERVDLVLDIGRGAEHNFDGPGRTLAWAFLPNGKDQQLLMRFDADEAWTVSGSGIRFRNVACHEFGHMIGLEHSRVQSALMAPFYSPAVVSPQKHDDVTRIQALYGPVAADPPDPQCPTICNLSLKYIKALNHVRRSWKMPDSVLNELAEKASQPCGNLCEAISKLFPKTGAVLGGAGSLCELIKLAAEYLPKLCPQQPK